MIIAVGIPCMGSICAETVGSLLRLPMAYRDIDFKPYIISHSLVYDARNMLVEYALSVNADYLLFVDSDILFPQDALANLINQNKQVISGVYYAKMDEPKTQIVYDEIKPLSLFNKTPSVNSVKHKITSPEVIKACGMGFCLIRTDALRKVLKKYKSPFEPMKGMGEDIAFCYRLGKVGIPIYAMDVKLEHIGSKRYKGE